MNRKEDILWGFILLVLMFVTGVIGGAIIKHRQSEPIGEVIYLDKTRLSLVRSIIRHRVKTECPAKLGRLGEYLDCRERIELYYSGNGGK